MSPDSLPLPRSIPRSEDIGQAKALIRSAELRIHALQAQIAAFEIAAIFTRHPQLEQLSFEWADGETVILLSEQESEDYLAYLDDGEDYEDSAPGFLQPAREEALSLFYDLGPMLQERLQETLFKRPPPQAHFSDHFMRELLGHAAFSLWQADALAPASPEAPSAPPKGL